MESEKSMQERSGLTVDGLIEKFRNDNTWNTPNADGSRRFDKKLSWMRSMFEAYAKYLEMAPDEAAGLIEAERGDYSWPNYYQEANFPIPESRFFVGAFENKDGFKRFAAESLEGFRCPKCGRITGNPCYCEKCGSKAYGFLRSGYVVIIKELGYMPISIFEPVYKEPMEAINE